MQGTHSAPPTGPSRQAVPHSLPSPLSLVKDTAASDPHRANLAALLARAVAAAAACHGCCLLPEALEQFMMLMLPHLNRFILTLLFSPLKKQFHFVAAAAAR